jgi:hypothetical protein
MMAAEKSAPSFEELKSQLSGTLRLANVMHLTSSCNEVDIEAALKKAFANSLARYNEGRSSFSDITETLREDYMKHDLSGAIGSNELATQDMQIIINYLENSLGRGGAKR